MFFQDIFLDIFFEKDILKCSYVFLKYINKELLKYFYTIKVNKKKFEETNLIREKINFEVYTLDSFEKLKIFCILYKFKGSNKEYYHKDKEKNTFFFEISKEHIENIINIKFNLETNFDEFFVSEDFDLKEQKTLLFFIIFLYNLFKKKFKQESLFFLKN